MMPFEFPLLGHMGWRPMRPPLVNMVSHPMVMDDHFLAKVCKNGAQMSKFVVAKEVHHHMEIARPLVRGRVDEKEAKAS